MRSLRRSALGARLRPGTVALVALLSITMPACVNRGNGDDPSTASAAPSPALGEAPVTLAPDQTAPLPDAEPVTSTTSGRTEATATTVTGKGPAATSTTTSEAPSTSTTSAGAPERAVVISSQRDGADVLGAPGYADLRALVVERIGTKLRVTVEVGAPIPDHLAEREVIGLGVDFSRPGAFESEAQLFVDGGVDGWRAYLQRGDGFVAYPGTFAIGGTRFVLEVPDSEMPHPLPSVVSSFLDWSTKTPAPRDSSDAMPDTGPLKPTP